MTSRNSFSETALLRDGVRRNLWGTVLAAIAFVMTLLLPVLMMMQNALELQKEVALVPAQVELAQRQWQNALTGVSTLLGGGNVFVKFAFLGLAVVCGVSAFAYLHSRQKVDLYHALPISRTRLFATNFATGILCVLPSYVIVLALSTAAAFAMGFGEAVDWSALAGAVASNLIVFLLVYALSALAAIVCGQTIISLLLLLWMLFGGAAAYALFGTLCDKFYRTFAYGTMMLSALRLSPPIEYFLLDGMRHIDRGMESAAGGALGTHMAYLVAAVLVTALACLLFRIRKSERAGSALAFDPAKLPVKVVMCAVIGAAVGLMFSGIVNDFWFWPGVVIGVVLCHWLIEIIYAFDFRAIFGKPLHCICILAALTALLLCMKADVTGYDKWLPDVDALSAVDLETSAYGIEPALKTPQNIAAVHRLAELGLMKPDPDSENVDVTSFDVSYQMQNGSTKQRQYTAARTAEVEALFAQIYATEEFKRAKWALFTYDPAALKTEDGKPAGLMGVQTEKNYDWQATLRGDKLVRVLDTLRAEALTRPDGARPVMSLELSFEETALYQNYAARGSTTVTEADFQTLALIAELTGVKPERLAPEQIESIVINYWGRDEEGRYLTGREVIADEADIAAMLRDAINLDALGNGHYYGGNDYLSSYALEEINADIAAIDTVLGSSYTLHYPKGKAPTAVLAKYPPTVDESVAEQDMAPSPTATAERATVTG